MLPVLPTGKVLPVVLVHSGVEELIGGWRPLSLVTMAGWPWAQCPNSSYAPE